MPDTEFRIGHLLFKKPMTRIELVTSPLPRVCSTAELHGLKTGLEQNPRPVSEALLRNFLNETGETDDGPSWI